MSLSNLLYRLRNPLIEQKSDVAKWRTVRNQSFVSKLTYYKSIKVYITFNTRAYFIYSLLIMEEAAFQKELSKYKVIRTPDYYKSRTIKTQRLIAKQITSTPVVKDTASSIIINSNESNFWELFSAANASILTTAESIKLIEALKAVRIYELLIPHFKYYTEMTPPLL